MLQVAYKVVSRPFRYPFTTHKGTKTHQPAILVALGLGGMWGVGEAPAINYYNVTAEGMAATLEANKQAISRYALTDPGRFWHFLHHLMPGEHFLTAALDIAAWDLFAKMRRVPLYKALGIGVTPEPLTDYTLGIESKEQLIARIKEQPWPVYKVKMGVPGDMELLNAVRNHTDSAIRIDVNEGWTFDECKANMPRLQGIGVQLIEQPLKRADFSEMQQLIQHSNVPFYADESCRTEEDVPTCSNCFNGINIKLTKCGGITPALRMIANARKLGLKVMLGSMNEGMTGTAAIVHMSPFVDLVDADGPLLLEPTGEQGLRYEQGKIYTSGAPGLGVKVTF